jgi:TniB protein
LTESIDERVYFVRSKRWIAYPKAVEILDHLNAALLKHPRTTRMPSLAVYGDSGLGKSMLIEKFKDDYALSASDRPDGQKTKVLVMEMAGVSARIFRMLNEVAVEAIETGAEQITDEALERYKPVGEDEAAFQ